MTTNDLTLGMIGSSNKENEKRVAIHPAHFPLMDQEARKRVFVERGYGRHFRIRDAAIERSVAGLMEREELFEKCDIVMIFKPTDKDFPFLREGQTLWGAVHTVQNPPIVDLAIDKKLTFIAMESMFLWSADGRKGVWIFNTQSELAGYSSVHHSLGLTGTKGWQDQPKKIAIISFGAAGRGAVHGFKGLEFTDITVYTQRPPISVLATIPSVKYRQYVRDPKNDTDVMAVTPEGDLIPFAEELAGYDIIVNCILQDTDRPLMYAYNRDIGLFKDGALIIDVSCDRGMGFEFARSTSFDEPFIEVGDRILYYAVDHSPSYFHNTASLEHSKTAHPYVKDIVGGREAWRKNKTIGNAIEIEDGVIVNPKILTFQNRQKEYPHRIR